MQNRYSLLKYARGCCAKFASYPSLLLFFQFFCWIQIINYNIKQAIVNLRHLRTINKDIDSQKFYPSMRQSKRRIRVVLRMKTKITRIYGTGCFFYQLFALMRLINVIFALSFVNYKHTIKGLNTFYLALNATTFILLAYLPHWAGQLIYSRVS